MKNDTVHAITRHSPENYLCYPVLKFMSRINAMQSLYRHVQTAECTPTLPPIKCLAKLVQTADCLLHTHTATYKMPCKACTDRRVNAAHPHCHL